MTEGEWIEWGGGDCPVEPGTEGGLRLRGGQLVEGVDISLWRWTHVEDASDIVRFLPGGEA